MTKRSARQIRTAKILAEIEAKIVHVRTDVRVPFMTKIASKSEDELKCILLRVKPDRYGQKILMPDAVGGIKK